MCLINYIIHASYAPLLLPNFKRTFPGLLCSGNKPEVTVTDKLGFITLTNSLSWWSQAGSNRRPPACKAGALPAELWPLDLSFFRYALLRSASVSHVHSSTFPPSLSRVAPGEKNPASTPRKYGSFCVDRGMEMRSVLLHMSIFITKSNSKWWVWEDLNFRPHPYQGCALTN